MVHCGYEPTAANDAFTNPLKMLWVSLRGIKTEGKMAQDIDLSKQRPADYVFSTHVADALATIHAEKARTAPAPQKSTVAAEA